MRISCVHRKMRKLSMTSSMSAPFTRCPTRQRTTRLRLIRDWIFFVLFIGDIVSGLDPGVHHIVFTSDLQIYVQGTIAEIQLVLQRLGENPGHVVDSAADNGLLLDVNKPKPVVFGTSFYVNKLNELDVNFVTVRGANVEVVCTVRSLGIILESTINCKEHVSYICKRANTPLYRLRHFRGSTNFSHRKHLLMSLLFPTVDYCSLVCCDIFKEQNSIIQRVLNRGIRYRRREHLPPRLRPTWRTTSRRGLTCTLRGGTPNHWLFSVVTRML